MVTPIAFCGEDRMSYRKRNGRNDSVTDRAMKLALSASIGLAIAAGLSGCSALPELGNDGSSPLQAFGIGNSGNDAAQPESTGTQSGTSHTTTDNDKLAYYKSQSADGKHEITSVLFLQRSDGNAITYDNLSSSLSQAGVNWYQAIIDTSTGDTSTKEGAHLYLPSGLSYDQITSIASMLTNAGYICDLLTPDEYDEYVNQTYSIYRVQMTYMGPAADSQ